MVYGNGYFNALCVLNVFFQLLNELKQVNFTVDNQTFYFSSAGSFVNGYHLINWPQNKSNGHREFFVIGGYKLEQEQIIIDKYIQWYSSNSNTVSVLHLIMPINATIQILKQESTCYLFIYFRYQFPNAPKTALLAKP